MADQAEEALIASTLKQLLQEPLPECARCPENDDERHLFLAWPKAGDFPRSNPHCCRCWDEMGLERVPTWRCDYECKNPYFCRECKEKVDWWWGNLKQCVEIVYPVMRRCVELNKDTGCEGSGGGISPEEIHRRSEELMEAIRPAIIEFILTFKDAEYEGPGRPDRQESDDEEMDVYVDAESILDEGYGDEQMDFGYSADSTEAEDSDGASPKCAVGQRNVLHELPNVQHRERYSGRAYTKDVPIPPIKEVPTPPIKEVPTPPIKEEPSRRVAQNGWNASPAAPLVVPRTIYMPGSYL